MLKETPPFSNVCLYVLSGVAAIFLVILEFYGKFQRKVDHKDTKVNKWKIFQRFFQGKEEGKKQNTCRDFMFHNSIQDGAIITVYHL